VIGAETAPYKYAFLASTLHHTLRQHRLWLCSCALPLGQLKNHVAGQIYHVAQYHQVAAAFRDARAVYFEMMCIDTASTSMNSEAMSINSGSRATDFEAMLADIVSKSVYNEAMSVDIDPMYIDIVVMSVDNAIMFVDFLGKHVLYLARAAEHGQPVAAKTK
jgi:hypothetical protein